jgi:hypothetical protein
MYRCFDCIKRGATFLQDAPSNERCFFATLLDTFGALRCNNSSASVNDNSYWHVPDLLSSNMWALYHECGGGKLE